MIFNYIFLFSSLMIILTPNAIYSILFLLLIFLNSTLYLFNISLDFIAFLLLIVYIGAIVVLLLGLIMLLTNKTSYQSTLLTLTLSFVISLLYFTVNLFYGKEAQSASLSLIDYSWLTNVSYLHSIHNIANILFNHTYNHILLYISMLLFIAMMGTIVLTLKTQSNIKKQYLFSQLYRNIS